MPARPLASASASTFALRAQRPRHASWCTRLVQAVVWCLLITPSWAAPSPQNVLVLYSGNRVLPGVAVIDQTIDAVLRAAHLDDTELFNEFLGLDDDANDPGYARRLAAFLHGKYAHRPIAAIVAVRGPALRFAVELRDQLFPGVPIVHFGVDVADLDGLDLPADVVGAAFQPEPLKTIELAMQLQPEARRLVVISGTSALDHQREQTARSAFEPLRGRIDVEYWTGLPMAELAARVRAVSPDTILYMPVMRQDGSGKRFVPQQVAKDLASIAPVPIYGEASNFDIKGTAGGYVTPLQDGAKVGAGLLVRLLRGEPATSLGPTPAVPKKFVLNMHQLARFGISPSALPPDATLRHRDVPWWEPYAWQIVIVALVLLLQAGLIVALVLQRRVRKKAEASLRESERRIRQAAAATGLVLWMHDRQRNEFWGNNVLRYELGLGPNETPTFESFVAMVHPADRERVLAAFDKAWNEIGRFHVESRAVVNGGVSRWVVLRGSVRRERQGGTLRMRGVGLEVTAQKMAEREAAQRRDELTHQSRISLLGQLSGSLAHELNQPLTAILSNAQAALRFLKAEAPDLDELREILADIVVDDQRAGDVIRRLRALFVRGETKNESIDVHQLIDQVLHLLQAELQVKQVTARLELQARPAQVLGDRTQLQQLLLNLVLNAGEAMAGLPAAERILRIRSECVIDELRIYVIDRGPGIAVDQLERVFQPFVSSKNLGLGLGLAISRSIAVAHRGRLWATSHEAQGAALCLALPLRVAGAGGPGIDAAQPATQSLPT